MAQKSFKRKLTTILSADACGYSRLISLDEEATLAAALSRAPGLFVIGRNSAAIYKGNSVDVKQVAEEQGVQYVLEGSVQKADDKLRITIQLVDALNGRHLRADRFDRQAKDIFAIQDEIVKQVMVELQVQLTQGAAERVASRGTDNLEAWLLRTEAYGELIKFTREGMIRARELYEAAHQADPNWSRPISALGVIDWYEAKQGWSTSKEASIQSGMALAQRAIQMNPKFTASRFMQSQTLHDPVRDHRYKDLLQRAGLPE